LKQNKVSDTIYRSPRRWSKGWCHFREGGRSFEGVRGAVGRGGGYIRERTQVTRGEGDFPQKGVFARVAGGRRDNAGWRALRRPRKKKRHRTKKIQKEIWERKLTMAANLSEDKE